LCLLPIKLQIHSTIIAYTLKLVPVEDYEVVEQPLTLSQQSLYCALPTVPVKGDSERLFTNSCLSLRAEGVAISWDCFRALPLAMTNGELLNSLTSILLTSVLLNLAYKEAV
jgi:hypothetical protein